MFFMEARKNFCRIQSFVLVSVRVQIPDPKAQKYLFYSPFTFILRNLFIAAHLF